MKSRSTYPRACRAVLLLVCAVGISGCGDPGFSDLPDRLKSLSGTYSYNYEYKGGLFSGPDIVKGTVKDSSGNTLPFCALKVDSAHEAEAPRQCRRLSDREWCAGIALYRGIDNGPPVGRKARVEMAARLRGIVYSETPAGACVL